jgi:hypothetical protein
MDIALYELDEASTNGGKVATHLADGFLFRLIDVAGLHVRKKGIYLQDSDEHCLPKAFLANSAKLEYVRLGVVGGAAS